MRDIILIIGTALISGLFATLITLFWQHKSQVFEKKYNIFKTLMSYRYMTVAEECVKALNSIDVVFYKDKKVRDAYEKFLLETEKAPEEHSNVDDKYLKLLEEISKSLKLEAIRWDTIKHTYLPSTLAEKIYEENLLRKIQIRSNEINIQHHNETTNTPSDEMIIKILPELLKNPDSLKQLLEVLYQYEGKQP